MLIWPCRDYQPSEIQPEPISPYCILGLGLIRYNYCILAIGQNITSVCYLVHSVIWDSVETRVILRGGVDNPPTLNVIPATSRGCFSIGPCWDPSNTFRVNIMLAKTTKISYFYPFKQIWPWCDLEITLTWPLDNSHMKPNTNLCHHVYLAHVYKIGRPSESNLVHDKVEKYLIYKIPRARARGIQKGPRSNC